MSKEVVKFFGFDVELDEGRRGMLCGVKYVDLGKVEVFKKPNGDWVAVVVPWLGGRFTPKEHIHVVVVSVVGGRDDMRHLTGDKLRGYLEGLGFDVWVELNYD